MNSARGRGLINEQHKYLFSKLNFHGDTSSSDEGERLDRSDFAFFRRGRRKSDGTDARRGMCVLARFWWPHCYAGKQKHRQFMHHFEIQPTKKHKADCVFVNFDVMREYAIYWYSTHSFKARQRVKEAAHPLFWWKGLLLLQ